MRQDDVGVAVAESFVASVRLCGAEDVVEERRSVLVAGDLSDILDGGLVDGVAERDYLHVWCDAEPRAKGVPLDHPDMAVERLRDGEERDHAATTTFHQSARLSRYHASRPGRSSTRDVSRESNRSVWSHISATAARVRSPRPRIIHSSTG